MNQPRIDLSRLPDGRLEFIADGVFAQSEPIVCDTSRGAQSSETFEVIDEQSFTLGGMPGTVVAETGAAGSVAVVRELFISKDQTMVALRYHLRNESAESYELNNLSALQLNGAEAMSLGGAGLDQWRVMRYPFNKSDIPSYFRPSVVDKDFEDAVFSCINAIPGQGVVYNTLNAETRTIHSGPITMFKHGEGGSPVLMFSILGLEDHMVDMSLTTSEDRQSLREFRIQYDFDGIRVDPGETHTTHWLLITAGEKETELLELYTRMVNAEHGSSIPSKPSPTIYCTWYFYTFTVRQQYVDDELEAIRQRRVPLDVFQIDDGWMDSYGTYDPDPRKFPNGMAHVAEQIRDAGMIPGIWVAPFVIDRDSPILKRYPNIMQRNAAGESLIYNTADGCYVIDPTRPEAREFFREMFAKLKGWGFRYFKLDWLRAIYEFSETRFHDPKVNRVKAYVMAQRYVNEAIGDDCFVLGCGGLSDPGNIGMVNGQRSSKDVRGTWEGPEGIPKSGALIQIKQNLFRNYINRFYHADPDATQIRIRKNRFSEEEIKCVGVYQSEGHYTDDEAVTICVQQYFTGGMITISERFPELQEERLALLRHISPAVTPPATIIDFDRPVCPTLFLTAVTPRCERLGNWWTLAVANWEDTRVERRIELKEIYPYLDQAPERLAAFEVVTQEYLGIVDEQGGLDIELPPHASRVIRLAPVRSGEPMVLGTDLHFSGGGCELVDCRLDRGEIAGRIETRWHYPVQITVGFPNQEGALDIVRKSFDAGSTEFSISQ